MLKKFDYFGVEIHFLYNNKYKYHSSIGGIIFIGFIITVVTYVFCSLPSFLKRKNMSLIFYDKEIEQTDQLNLKNYSIYFGIGLTCDGYSNRTHLYDLFSISMSHVTMDSYQGKRKKTKQNISLSPCTYENFNNEFNESFDINGFNNIFCPNDTNYTLSGIYQDSIFRYIEVIVGLTREGINKTGEVKEIMQNFECRLAIHHVDTTINVYDYHLPVKRFISTHFETLKYNMMSKMNVFFLQQNFFSYDNYLFDSFKTKYSIGFSSVDQYVIDKGYDRITSKVNDYQYFGKLYLRAASERTIIIRKYMKLTEFVANMSSIFSQIFLILLVLVKHLNRMFSSQSIIKQILKFSREEKLERIRIERSNNKSEDPKRVKFTNSKNITFNQNMSNLELLENLDKEDRLKSLQNIHNNFMKFSEITKKEIFSNISDQNLKNKEIEYNIYETFIKIFAPCFSNKTIKKKNRVYKIGIRCLKNKMDIFTYLKMLQQLDISIYTLFNQVESQMIHFLSKPSISLVNQNYLVSSVNLENNVNIKGKEIEEFISNFKLLFKKQRRTSVEEKIVDISLLEMNKLFLHN